MKKPFLLILSALLLAGAALAYETVHCAYHDYAYCYSTGQQQFVNTLGGNHKFEKYHCSCGDDVWVRVY